jgi:hypothetical protein
MAKVTGFLFNPFAVLGIVAFFAFAAVFGRVALLKRNIQLNPGNAVLAVTLLLAVFQWHASIEQNAMQRWEEEITNANNAESSPDVAAMLARFYTTPGEYAKARYIYISLDNLEYALERYREGFASATTTARAVMTFAGHCEEKNFRDLATDQVKGYPPFVGQVVNSVIKKYPWD